MIIIVLLQIYFFYHKSDFLSCKKRPESYPFMTFHGHKDKRTSSGKRLNSIKEMKRKRKTGSLFKQKRYLNVIKTATDGKNKTPYTAYGKTPQLL